ncbi:MAG TPA: EexN family lipoprotein [Kaistia sp.]|jgi:hypothetical protein|nr:EexN family lipoprotein [Kaistia sp.]
MKWIAIGIVTTLLVACSEAPRETVITVSEFLADASLRADHIDRCRQNPGALGQTANCRNAEQAQGKARLERMNRALGG